MDGAHPVCSAPAPKVKLSLCSALVATAIEPPCRCLVHQPGSEAQWGEKKGWRKITQRRKCFLLKKEPKQRKHKKRTSEEMIVFDHLTAHNSTVLNNELNWRNTDWAKEASEIKSLLAESKQ